MLTLLEMVGRVVQNDEVVRAIPETTKGLKVARFELTDRHRMVTAYTPNEKGHLTASIYEQQSADKIVAVLEDGSEIVLKDRHGTGT